MSRQASDAMLVYLKLNISPLSGSRGGSLCTSLQTSDINIASRSLIWLCRIETYPPFLHTSEWSRVFCSPHEQKVGVPLKGKLYLKWRASRNSCLLNMKTQSSRERDVNKAEVPFLHRLSI